jgi:glutathione S-transferase
VPSDTPKLYEATSSPNSRRVRIFLAEKGIGIRRVPVDSAKALNRPIPEGHAASRRWRTLVASRGSMTV